MAIQRQRYVADIMAEVALKLLEPLTVLPLASPVAAGSAVTLTVSPSTAIPNPLPPTITLYPGAEVVVGWPPQTYADAEVVEVIEVLSPTQFTANLQNAHAAGETVFAATFPTQQPTDPIYSQQEILGYIAQVQNEFLTRVPLLFSFAQQLVTLGQAYQTLPATAIELERVAVESLPPQATFGIASITRAGGTVTATLSSTSAADSWTPALPVLVSGVTDSTFNSASNSAFTLATVSSDGLTLTWPQPSASDSASSGGQVSRPVWTRLYEASQESLSMNQSQWQMQPGQPPRYWAEDRAGVYGWLVMPPPAGAFWMELLTSQRGPEALGLLSQLEVPDIFAYAIIWGVMEYAWTKDGVNRSPSLARFAKGKFDHYCLLADRYLRAMAEGGR